jgi:uncharacterized spore protein YtfJ
MDIAMEEIAKALEEVGNQLGEIASGDAVVGSPIQLGSVTVHPISRISVGMGGGGGEGEDTPRDAKNPDGRESGVGGGVGGGVKARPVALLVFSQDGVNVLPIPDKKGKLDILFEKIPELVERFKKPA